MGLLASNAWLVGLLLPTLHVGGVGLVGTLRLAAPAVPIALGLRSIGQRPERARAWLLGGFPAALGLAVAVDPRLTAEEAYGAFGLAVAALSLLAVLAAAAAATGRTPAARAHRHRFFSDKAPVREPVRRRVLRRTLVGLVAVAALGLVAVAPTVGDPGGEAWGPASREGEVLTAVVAAMVAAAAIGWVVGPNLRAARRRSADDARALRRAGLYLALAVTGGLAALLLRG